MVLSDALSAFVFVALARVKHQNGRDDEDNQASSANHTPLPKQQRGVLVPGVDTDGQVLAAYVRKTNGVLANINCGSLHDFTGSVVVGEHGIEVLEEHATEDNAGSVDSTHGKVDDHELARGDSVEGDVLGEGA